MVAPQYLFTFGEYKSFLWWRISILISERNDHISSWISLRNFLWEFCGEHLCFWPSQTPILFSSFPLIQIKVHLSCNWNRNIILLANDANSSQESPWGIFPWEIRADLCFFLNSYSIMTSLSLIHIAVSWWIKRQILHRSFWVYCDSNSAFKRV